MLVSTPVFAVSLLAAPCGSVEYVAFTLGQG